jgi:hypothetical protein
MHSCMQELLLRLLQLAASKRQVEMVAEGAALATYSMGHAATNRQHGNYWCVIAQAAAASSALAGCMLSGDACSSTLDA